MHNSESVLYLEYEERRAERTSWIEYPFFLLLLRYKMNVNDCFLKTLKVISLNIRAWRTIQYNCDEILP